MSFNWKHPQFALLSPDMKLVVLYMHDKSGDNGLAQFNDRTASYDLGYTPMTVRDIINRLVDDEIVTEHATNVYSLCWMEVKQSYGKEQKKKKLNHSFSDFMTIYGKRTTLHTAEAAWWRLSDKERQKAMDHVGQFVRGRELKYRPDPVKYINEKRFLDQPEAEKAHKQTQQTFKW